MEKNENKKAISGELIKILLWIILLMILLFGIYFLFKKIGI